MLPVLAGYLENYGRKKEKKTSYLEVDFNNRRRNGKESAFALTSLNVWLSYTLPLSKCELIFNVVSKCYLFPRQKSDLRHFHEGFFFPPYPRCESTIQVTRVTSSDCFYPDPYLLSTVAKIKRYDRI